MLVSVIESLQWLVGENVAVPLAGLITTVVTTVIMVLIAEAFLKGKQSKGSSNLAKDAQSESARRWQKQSLALMKLAQPKTLNGRPLKAVIQEISEVAADALEVGRVSVWLYQDNYSELDCIDVYELCTNHHESGRRREARTEVLSVPQSSINPSRLDVPILQNEQIIGVVSYEQTASNPRLWTHQDEEFGSAIANLITLGLEACNHQQATQTLRTSESHYRFLVQHSPDLISQQTVDGVYLYTSSACQTLLGYEPQELVGRSIYELVHPQDTLTLEQTYSNLLGLPELEPVSYRIRHQSGNYIWLESKVTPIRHPDTDRVTEVVVVSREVTKRKQVESQLYRASPHQLDVQTLAAEQLAGTQLLGVEGLKVDFSYTAQAPVVRSTSAPPTRSRISMLAAVVEDRLMSVMALLGNQPLSKASRRTFGWVANAIAVAIDQYWARSELLSRREALLFGLANQIRNSLELDTILETTVQSIRSLLKIDRCQILWYRSHERDPYWEVVQEARNPRLPSHIGHYKTVEIEPFAERLLNRQIIQVDEVEVFSDPGLRQFLIGQGYTSILSIPIQTHAGEIAAISCGHGTGLRPWDNSEVELLQAVVTQLAIALDQAELYAQARQSAQIAQAQAQELERTLNQLKATQAQLVQSEKMSSLGQLVAGVAHELNNPVNFIHNNLTYASAYIYDLLSLVQLYQEHFSNPPTPIREQAALMDIDFIADDLPKLLRSMQRGTDRISSIVLSLRNFSRLDEAEMKHVDLNKGIDSTLLVLQHRLKPKGEKPEIQVVKEYGNLPKIECYPGQLNQVFLNILNNAIDALEQSFAESQESPSPAILIRTRMVDFSEENQHTLSELTEYYSDSIVDLEMPNPPKSQRIVIQIADNGPGMSESVKARLFDPFFSTKPVGQGTGLGLTICYQIVVKHHQGLLNCTSVPGQGTEFRIEIPIKQSLD